MMKILEAGKVAKEQILARGTAATDVSVIVSEILATVRAQGDTALRAYSERFDHAKLTSFEVTPQERDEALDKVEPEFLAVLQRAAANIRAFHEKQLRSSFLINEADGILLGQKILPIEKVGLYVPGGTAAYPSTVLMDSIPAKLAGCSELVITTPPDASGKVNPAILAAAKIAGVDRIFKVGGAQAIAALAYGTQSIPRVDKIVGPGNAYVAEAKKQVFGQVAIDMVAGPSEILIVADESCEPRFLAADLLSQAEHDRLASAVLITDSMSLAQAVQQELSQQLTTLPRREIAAASINDNGKIIVCTSLTEAIALANELAPEHLELCMDNPFDYLDKVKNAGSVFLGKYCPEALGDYFAGANHTLPTGGTARFSSPLSVDDFIKKTQYTYYTKEALQRVSSDIARFAGKEGLDAHARSVLIRGEQST